MPEEQTPEQKRAAKLARRRKEFGIGVVAFLFVPFVVKGILDNFSAWAELSSAYPVGEVQADNTQRFRSMYLNGAYYYGTAEIGWTDEYLVFNYHLLFLPGGTRSAIPRDVVEVAPVRVGAIDWVAVKTPDAPEIWLLPGLASKMGLDPQGDAP